jgi:hypothetical protein
MADHAGHTPGMKMPPDAAEQGAPAKTDAAAPSAPAKADPHAGHDMGGAAKPAEQKAADKK